MTDELTELKARVAELERAAAPPKPYINDWVPPPHPIDRVSMHPSTMREFAAAVPTNVVRDIVGDNRGAPTGPASPGPASAPTPANNVSRPAGTGWAREVPLGPQPGVHHIDRLMAHEDIEFRRQRIAEAQALKAATEDKPSEQTNEGDL